MKYRTLGKNLTVSTVGLGCMGFSHAYGAPADKNEMRELLAQAVDIGCNFFDTAEAYGTPDNPHDNEELVGAALKPYRDKVVIGTKFGIYFDETSPELNKPVITDARPATIKKAVDGSLKRLQTDYIDIYWQHRQDSNVPVEEVAGVMQELIDAGKILSWGLSEVDEEIIRRACKVCPPAAVQNRYSMMFRQYEKLFPVLEELNVGLVAFSPLANGLLSGAYDKNSKFDANTDYRSMMPQFKAEALDKNQALLDLLENLAARKGATKAQISLAWMIDKKPYIVPIPGTRKLSRLKENVGAADVNLTAAEVKALDDALDNMEMSAVYDGTQVKTR